MTAQPQPRAARVPTRTPSEQDDVRQLVRHIASEPHLVQWLREHVAGHLQAAAAELSRDQVDRAPESVIARRADAHRRGETPLW